MAVALQNFNYGAMGLKSSYNQDQRVMRRVMKPRDPRPCPHYLWLINDTCLNCGKKLHNHRLSATPYFKSRKNLSTIDLNKTCISSSNNVEVKATLQNPNKKMYLVLDLDHTLLNSTPLDSLSFEEDYLRILSTKDGSTRGFYRLNHIGIATKLRPYVRTFLEEASKMFEMSVNTMGDRPYALEMAKLLDPENKYFNSRIISRDDCQQRLYKGLDVIQKPENSVLVLDDTPQVWPNNKDNLIVMDRYMYFSSGCRKFGVKCKSLAELKRDEDESHGALSSVLQVLKRIHRHFFENSNTSINKDVRELVKDTRKNVLNGCKLVFSGVFPKNNYDVNNHQLWKMAEELGANCVIEVDSSVTHVVSIDGGTEKSKWGIREGKFVVHPRWIEASYYLWRRQIEDRFKVVI